MENNVMASLKYWWKKKLSTQNSITSKNIPQNYSPNGILS